MSNRVFVIGVGMTKFEKPGARDWDYPDMGREAGERALADAGIDPSQDGLASAPSQVVEFANKPPRSAGQVVKDEGDGGVKIADFLVTQKLV